MSERLKRFFSHGGTIAFITGFFLYIAVVLPILINDKGIFTIMGDYKRDIAKGIDIALPENYYPNDDPDQKPLLRWRGAANAMYSNWINYYVYQETPFEFINTEAVLSKHQNS